MNVSDPPRYSSTAFILLANIFGSLLLFVGGPCGAPLVGIAFLPWTCEMMRYRAAWLVWCVVYLPPIVLGIVLWQTVADSAAILGTIVTFIIMVPLADRLLQEYPPPPNACRQCGYDLRGLKHERCPECGSEQQCDPPAPDHQ